MRKSIFIFSLVFIVAITSGCLSTNEATFEATNILIPQTIKIKPTDTATAQPSPTITPYSTATASTIPSPIPILSHTLYYLEGSQEGSQVWRLGVNGLSKTKITDEKTGVEEFAVSPVNGEIAFISDNQLFLMDKESKNVLLIADGHSVDENVDDHYFRSWVSSPVFSPDGRLLAYGFNGLHLYNLATGEDSHILTNLGNLLGEVFVFSKEAYVPGPWSPDGSQLLIIMTYYEGSTLAVMDLDAEQPFRRLWSEGPVCCIFNWSADGNSVLVSNPHYSIEPPGLWSFDSETGEQSEVVPGLPQDGSINFVGWPMKLDSGDLYFFFANLEQFSPDVGIPMRMVRSDPDGMNPNPVRPETFRINNVLWVQDGSAALILQLSEDHKTQVLLARIDGSPLKILFEGERVRNLMWGP